MKNDKRSIVRRTLFPESASVPVVPPLYPSVVYASADADELDAQYRGDLEGYTYAREGHPNASVLADKIDWLEGVSGGTITGSGMAAISLVFLSILKPGDHVIAGNQLYGRSLRLLTRDLARLGVSCTLVDPSDADATAAAVTRQTRLILVEVVSNPTLRVADINAIAAITKAQGLLLMVDNTFTTPRAFQPFLHGADLVVHSVTKMLAGHSDVTLGYVSAMDEEMNQALHDAVVTWGFTPSPFDCWLAERGLNTFELRYDRAQQNAGRLADHLAGLAGVERVLYPGRADHPDHLLAARLLGGNYGNMLSFELKGSRNEVNRFIRSSPGLPFAPTLGDVATLLSHPASSSHRALTAGERENLGISEGLIRVSVGVENFDLIAQEFTHAMDVASA